MHFLTPTQTFEKLLIKVSKISVSEERVDNTQIAKIVEEIGKKVYSLLVTIGSIAKFGENHRYAIEVLSQRLKSIA
jgi:hypothetical protein